MRFLLYVTFFGIVMARCLIDKLMVCQLTSNVFELSFLMILSGTPPWFLIQSGCCHIQLWSWTFYGSFSVIRRLRLYLRLLSLATVQVSMALHREHCAAASLR